jgi:predicted negative regulator of RcsB-dependent stress response
MRRGRGWPFFFLPDIRFLPRHAFMKTQRRHELATNVLADWLGEKIEALKPYSTAVSATAVAVVAVVFASVFWYQQRQAGRAQAWESYFSALEEQNPDDARDDLEAVADDYSKSPAGLWARLGLADTQLAKGVEELFKDHASARKALEGAIDDYRAVLEQAPGDSLLAERSTFGLAESYESKNELESARQHYRDLLDRWPSGAFSSMAKDRLADLDRKATKDFYDWFAKQSPQTKQSKGSGLTGKKPAFDFDKLPTEHPFDSGLGVDGKKPGTKARTRQEPLDDFQPNDSKSSDSKPSDSE